MDPTKTPEPVRVFAAIQAFVTAVLALVAIFTDISNELVGAIMLVLTTGFGLWSAFVVRNQVTPVGTSIDQVTVIERNG